MFTRLFFSVWMAAALSANPMPGAETSFWTEFQTGAQIRTFLEDDPEAYRAAEMYVCDWFYDLISPVMGWE